MLEEVVKVDFNYYETCWFIVITVMVKINQLQGKLSVLIVFVWN